MNETYVECMVAHKKSPIAKYFKIMMYGLAIICLVGGMFVGSIGVIPAILLVLVGYFVAPRLDVEYEYLYLDKSISIDKVIGKEKRKHVMDIDLNTMEIMAPVTSHELDSYKVQNIQYKEYASGEEGARVYAIVCNDKDSKMMIGIEPNEEMLKVIKMFYPRQLKEY